jgi:hypothetical protein
MNRQTIYFPNGNQARAIELIGDSDGGAIAIALKLLTPGTVLVVNGGASGLSPTDFAQLHAHMREGVARLAAREGITVIDGGTQAGVMQMAGAGRAAVGGDASLIGVCPAALVTWPAGPTGGDHAPLEPNHNHFVLTGGKHFGAETATMFTLFP